MTGATPNGSLRRRVTAVAAVAGLVAGGATAVATSATAAPRGPAGGPVPLAGGVHRAKPVVPANSGGRAGLVRRRVLGLPKRGNAAFLLRLDATSTSAVYASFRRRHGTASARRAARAQAGRVATIQNRVIAALPARSSVVYRTHAALAAVAVVADVHDVDALRHVAGVSAVYPIALKKPALTYAVPLQRGDAAWQAYGDLGANSTIAVIDTGVDYTHADLGGPGGVSDYATALANDAAVPDPNSYDHSKFNAFAKDVHGKPAYMYDFAGDSYDPDPSSAAYQPVPHPDPNPLDCNSHGTHVAGIAAGYGENADGSTYTGAYGTATPFDTMRIGPGIAPKARLYAYKVFGCDGSTDLVGQAIDRAMDPNGDGDTSDHADVVNISIGSDYSFPDDGDSVLTNAAAQIAGVTMVVASGNGGDVYDVGGSPGDAVRAITVANSQDNYAQTDALNVSGPPGIQGAYAAERSDAYDWTNGADLSGDVARVSDPANLEGCNPLSIPDAAAVKGKIAFVDWTDDDNARPCGSAARAANLAAAGATGFIFGDDVETFSGSITGSDTIPGVIVAKSGAEAIRNALVANQAVTISGTTHAGFAQNVPGHDDTLDSASSRGIRDSGNVKPDIAAVGETVFSAGMGTGNQGLNDSGTSMASPMVAGAAALVKSKHPEWTPEQVKADLMNTADADLFRDATNAGPKYAPNRVGAGRLDIKAALDNSVLAFTADGPNGTSRGNVSASFGSVAIPVNAGIWRSSKTIKVFNTGFDAVSYAVGFDARTTIPGVTFTVSPSTLVVQARQTGRVTLTVTIDPTKLTKTIDPTVQRNLPLPTGDPSQPTIAVPRQYVADASGLVTLDDQDPAGTDLRVPAYVAPRPAAVMTQPASLTMPSGSVSRAALRLSGHQVRQGSGASAIQSIVAGFELQAVSGIVPRCTGNRVTGCWDVPDERAADLKYVGATSDVNQLRSVGQNPLTNGFAYFAITTQVPYRHPTSPQSYELDIDTTGDGVVDVIAFTTRVVPSTLDTDIMVTELWDVRNPNSPVLLDDEPLNESFGDLDTAIFDSDTFVMPIAIGALPGISATRSRITYAVLTSDGYHNGAFDHVGSVTSRGRIVGGLTLDVLHPGVSVAGHYDGSSDPLLYQDVPGTALVVTRNNAAYAADHGRGALIVHFHDVVGRKAQVVSFARPAPAARLTFSRSTVRGGRLTTGAVRVSGGYGAATGSVTVVRLATRHLRSQVVARGQLRGGRLFFHLRMRVRGTYRFQIRYGGDPNYRDATFNRGQLTIT